MWRIWNTSTPLLGMQNGAATTENSLAIPHKIKYHSGSELKLRKSCTCLHSLSLNSGEAP